MDLLRFATAGNVDDGKSTLIGRLLHDCRALLDDQLDSLRRASNRLGEEGLNLAFATDGLRAERAQNITIDVAYRFFSTGKRRFILADCPGHLGYLPNMVTGLSTANLAVVLVDVRHGLVEQTRRHCFLASLFRISHLVLCVNKMDLVDFAQSAFSEVREQFEAFSQKVAIHDVTVIPMSAKLGDNVVERSATMPWYPGPPLLRHLENVHIASDINQVDCRLPVQISLGPRTWAGRLASGHLCVGDEVALLPGGARAAVAGLTVACRAVAEARAPVSVAVELDHDVDIRRGDLLVRVHNRPDLRDDVDAMVCWFGAEPLVAGRNLRLLHGPRQTRATVSRLDYRFDMQTLSREINPPALCLNDIGRIQLRADQPLCPDRYQDNRATGSFVLVDEANNRTVAACMVR
jgi:sulfate adenylyltransferase large subunit